MGEPRPAVLEASSLPSVGMERSGRGASRPQKAMIALGGVRISVAFRLDRLGQQLSRTECSLPRSNKSATWSRDWAIGSAVALCIMNPFPNHDSPFLLM